MNIECLFANGDIVEVMSTPMPASSPPDGYAYVVETLQLADIVKEGVVLRKRVMTYDRREVRPLVLDVDEEACIVVTAQQVPYLLQMDVNGKTRLARVTRDEDNKPVLDADGPLVAMQLPGENVLDFGPYRDEEDEDAMYLDLSELLNVQGEEVPNELGDDLESE